MSFRNDAITVSAMYIGTGMAMCVKNDAPLWWGVAMGAGMSAFTIGIFILFKVIRNKWKRRYTSSP